MDKLTLICILTSAMLVSGCSVDCTEPPDASFRPIPSVEAYISKCTANKKERCEVYEYLSDPRTDGTKMNTAHIMAYREGCLEWKEEADL